MISFSSSPLEPGVHHHCPKCGSFASLLPPWQGVRGSPCGSSHIHRDDPARAAAAPGCPMPTKSRIRPGAPAVPPCWSGTGTTSLRDTGVMGESIWPSWVKSPLLCFLRNAWPLQDGPQRVLGLHPCVRKGGAPPSHGNAAASKEPNIPRNNTREGSVCKMQPREPVKGPFCPRKNAVKSLHHHTAAPNPRGVSALSLGLMGLSTFSGVKVHSTQPGSHLLSRVDKEPWCWLEIEKSLSGLGGKGP